MEKYSPKEWLLIDIGSRFGLDKKDYRERLQWATDNLDCLEELAYEAENQPQYIAAVKAYRHGEAGIPSGYLVGLDSAASGIQLLSVVGKCEIGMKNTGAIDSGTRPDIYTTLTNNMKLPQYPRKYVKKALMTYFYGSSAQPKALFGEDSPELALFYREAEKVAPAAYLLRNAMISLWDSEALSHNWTMPDYFYVHKQVMATKTTRIQSELLNKRSFSFIHKVNEPVEKSVALAANITHSIDAFVVREVVRRCNYNVDKLNKVLYTINRNIPVSLTSVDRDKVPSLIEVDYINNDTVSEYSLNHLTQIKELILASLKRPSFEMIVIHDEFKCHPNNVETMRYHYNQVLWDLYNGTLMEDIIAEMKGDTFLNLTGKETINPYNHTTAALVSENSYAIN